MTPTYVFLLKRGERLVVACSWSRRLAETRLSSGNERALAIGCIGPFKTLRGAQAEKFTIQLQFGKAWLNMHWGLVQYFAREGELLC